MDDQAPFQQKMVEIGDRYLRRTMTELQRLKEALQALKGGDRSLLADINQIAHKVHGSGAMFGFHAVSEAAGELERCIEPYLDDSSADLASFIAHCEQMITRLDAETRNAAQSRGVDV